MNERPLCSSLGRLLAVTLASLALATGQVVLDMALLHHSMLLGCVDCVVDATSMCEVACKVVLVVCSSR